MTRYQKICWETSTPEKMAIWMTTHGVDESWLHCPERPECAAMFEDGIGPSDEACLKCLIA